MSTRIRCFFLEPTDRIRLSYRRFSLGNDTCPVSPGGTYHNAKVVIGEDLKGEEADRSVTDEMKKDPRWPTTCEACPYIFKETDYWQIFPETVCRRTDNGIFVVRGEAPVGAMWYADWMGYRTGPDGHHLIVKVPGPHGGHEWWVESRASNCTMPDDNEHRCWVRHGTPPNVTVDKSGKTCGAGGGSILTHTGWHGFLRNGYLVEA